MVVHDGSSISLQCVGTARKRNILPRFPALCGSLIDGVPSFPALPTRRGRTCYGESNLTKQLLKKTKILFSENQNLFSFFMINFINVFVNNKQSEEIKNRLSFAAS